MVLNQCCIQEFFGHFLEGLDDLVISKTAMVVAECQKYLMFNAFGEIYLCLLKRFLF